jgi:polar amino acid transport system permease protein
VRSLLLAPTDARAPAPSLAARLLNGVAVFALISLVFTFAFQQLDYHWNWPAVWSRRALFWRGWLTTLALAGASLVLSALLGVAAAFLGRSRLLAARALSRIYVEVIRGTPLLVQILIFFYVVTPAFGITDRYIVGVVTLSVFAGAYLTEIVRGGIESVGRSQWDAARSIGLTRAQIYRHVVLPQAWRQILPPVTGQFVSLIKDSSLLSIIGIREFALNAQQVNAVTYSTLESYIPLAAGYLILTLPLSLWARGLERRAHYET